MINSELQKGLDVALWPIGRLKPYDKNPRVRSKQAVAKVAASIREFGFRQPIVCDENDVILVGHTRLDAAVSLGLTEVPVHQALGLSEAQKTAYRIADNRTNEETAWNDDLLKFELQWLDDMKFDLSLTGFDMTAVEGYLRGVNPTWDGMPDFNQEDLMAWQTVKVHFRNQEDRDAFSRLVGQSLTDQSKYIWHPRDEGERSISKRYTTDRSLNPRYPVYVISKGRWESRLTSKILEELAVPYRIVVEPQELEQYAAVIDREKILVLPFTNLGLGSIPARNWVWEHALSEGAKRHWILDDNIRTFYRLNDNTKIRVDSGVLFRAAEDFTDRYLNVALSGFNYQWLAKQKQSIPPFVANTRIYSCILIDNGLAHRWRGRYNEDTDLSLRALKDGLCTIQFNAFLADKQSTMTMKGGNTDELYQGDGRLKMAQSLQEQHPDVVTITKKWGRYQHQVDYRPFKKNRFIQNPDYVPSSEPNNYGMDLQFVEAGKATLDQ